MAALKQVVCCLSLNYSLIWSPSQVSLPYPTTLTQPLESKFNEVLSVLCISCSITFNKTLKQCSLLISLLIQTKPRTKWLQQILGGHLTHHPDQTHYFQPDFKLWSLIKLWTNWTNKGRCSCDGKILFIQSQSIYPQCWFTATRHF